MQIVTLFNGTESLKQAEDFVPKLNCNAKETMIYLPLITGASERLEQLLLCLLKYKSKNNNKLYLTGFKIVLLFWMFHFSFVKCTYFLAQLGDF